MLEGRCDTDSDCSADLACLAGRCVDPCSRRAACGDNALCSVVLHKPRCECPQCHVGKPHVSCRLDPACAAPTSPVIEEKEEPSSGCKKDTDCSATAACNRNTGQCIDPCGSLFCESNKKCIVAGHKPTCQCKHSLVINHEGSLTCPDREVECRQHADCPSNQACSEAGRCRSPCDASDPSATTCPKGKQCQVLDHKAVCMCVEGCNPSVSICLKDRGCPPGQACIGYQCRNPCEEKKCPNGTPCEVEDHKAVCKFCPPGFTTDPNYGCIKG